MVLAQTYPTFPALVRGQPSPLKVDPKRGKMMYGAGKMVIIRDIEPGPDGKINVQTYSEHSYPVTAVAMAPSGCYVASGDNSGVVRIWACDNPEQILKLETSMFAGAILDIAWSGDSQRLLAVGNGSSVFGKVVMWDSGNSVGEITGHVKKINSCAFKATRPFRLVTGGEDNKVNYFEGPPFKFKSTVKTHERFVNTVAYAPDGERFFSVSSDSFVAVFGGKDGALIIEKKVHSGSIYSACWSADSAQILTCSGDGSSKVLDASTLDEVAVLNFKSGDRKKTVEEQQVGCLWGATGLLSYSLGGKMSLFRSATDAAPALVQYGHTKPIAAMVYVNGSLLSSAFEDSTGTLRGQLLQWDVKSGVATGFEGELHSNMIIGLGCASTGELVTCGADDTVAFIKPSAPLEVRGDKLALGAAPKGFGCGGALVAVVTTTDKLLLISASEKKISKELKLAYSPTCVSVASNDAFAAVGGEDNLVHVVGADGGDKFTLSRHKDHVSTVAISPGCDKIASGCNNKEVVVWSAVDGAPLVTGLSGFHTARIYCLAWAPDNSGLASGGVDATIILWDLEAKKAKETIKNAHTGGAIRALCYADAGTLYSAGQDACIKKWSVSAAVELS